jgi:CRISPR system Cascade subunit CasA
MRYNLVTDSWIPAIRTDGTAVELGLLDALVHAHEFAALHGESPLVAAALYRLLLALLHRVFGPPTLEQWTLLWE